MPWILQVNNHSFQTRLPINYLLLSGNILVASTYHGRLELFSPDGEHRRTFDPSKLQSPTGMCLQGNTLCILDSRGKKLHIFSVAEQ